MLCLLALFIDIVAGLRSMTALAAISWAACLGHLDFSGSWLSFLGSPWVIGILSVLALAEFVTGGAVCGAALGVAAARQRLTASFGRDLPAGHLEDAVAILAALAIVWSL